MAIAKTKKGETVKAPNKEIATMFAKALDMNNEMNERKAVINKKQNPKARYNYELYQKS